MLIDKGESTSQEIIVTDLVVNTDALTQSWLLISVEGILTRTKDLVEMSVLTTRSV